MKNNLITNSKSDHSTHQAWWCGLEFEFIIKNKKFIIPYIYCIQKVIFTT